VAGSAEIEAMRHALALAADPAAPLGPNPRVGCVLLGPDGSVLGEGFHHGAGSPHAEVEALRAAGDQARGATAVVTLEPCDHIGRTGPCSRALLAAGVARVVFGQPDTTAAAAGGARTLRAAGVDVEGGVLAADASALNPEWTFAARAGRPWVTWKFASSLDGRVAAADGSSRWITGPESRADVHAWRSRCHAVVVGTGTVLADDPALTVRDAWDEPLPAKAQPTRVVVGLRPPPAQARVWDATAPTRHLATRDPAAVLAALAADGAHHVWLEGGPRLAAAFVAAELVDRVVAYYAPLLLGEGLGALGPAGVPTLAAAPRLQVTDVRAVGSDVRVVAERADRAAGRQPEEEES
jgi:diaminohydroxyphosphoribosylaminopyrimidine deaminase/5-amino-6-(5-phosphoribosylamino)uracil reductase